MVERVADATTARMGKKHKEMFGLGGKQISRRTLFQSAATAASEAASPYLRLSRKFSIRFEDLEVGRQVGGGGYCHIHEVKMDEKTCAVKRIKENRKCKPKDIVEGVADLASEAAILTNLDHPNIIQVHGMAAGPIRKSVTSDEGFFMVMELLEMTLSERIDEWRENVESRARRTRRHMLQERLKVALELAKAIQYLHSQDIVHRDLKPNNIGFDEGGVLKLFDFGFALKLARNRYTRGTAGTVTYMAPEMALRRTYDSSVDVYSFGLLLWEMCSMKEAFPGFGENTYLIRVVENEERPWIQMWWPSALKSLMRKCWSAKPCCRPSIDEVVAKLEAILERI